MPRNTPSNPPETYPAYGPMFPQPQRYWPSRPPYLLPSAGLYGPAAPGPGDLAGVPQPHPGRSPPAGLDAPQTVEQIIADGYLVLPPGEPATAPVTDRNHSSKLGLDDLILQIRQRVLVWQQNVDDLEQAKLAAINTLHDLAAEHGLVDPQQQLTTHRLLQDLYRQQRDERASLWRDLSRLRQALPDAAQRYLSAHRKLDLLEGVPGGDL